MYLNILNNMNIFEQLEDLEAQVRRTEGKICMGLGKWLNDHAAEICPDYPNSVLFTDYYMSRGELYVTFSADYGENSYNDSRKVELEEALKYIN